jgi:hypothetical protein
MISRSDLRAFDWNREKATCVKKQRPGRLRDAASIPEMLGLEKPLHAPKGDRHVRISTSLAYEAGRHHH